MLALYLFVVFRVPRGRQELRYTLDAQGAHEQTAGPLKHLNIVRPLLVLSGKPTYAGIGMITQGPVSERVTWKRVEKILHLDCVLSTPRKGLAIVCEEAHVGGLPDCIKNWDLIKVSLEDTSRLAVIGLPVDESNYIMSYNDHVRNDFVREELERRGITVHPVYFDTHDGQGGSIRCATQPLKRASAR